MVKKYKFHKEVVFLVDKDRAESILPLLRLIREKSPQRGDKELADSLIRKLRGIKDEGWKQILVTKKERDLIASVDDFFPGGVAPESGRQLTLFGEATLSGKPLPKPPAPGLRKKVAPTKSPIEIVEGIWTGQSTSARENLAESVGLSRTLGKVPWERITFDQRARLASRYVPTRGSISSNRAIQ